MKEKHKEVVRPMKIEEQRIVYKTLYQEWGKGSSKNQFYSYCSKQEERGTRYVLINSKNKIVSSMLLIPLSNSSMSTSSKLYGISSVCTHCDYRNFGYAQTLLTTVISNLQHTQHSSSFLLYADISPSYYLRLGFKEMPQHLQRYSSTIFMVKSDSKTYQELYFHPREKMPTINFSQCL